MSVELTSDHSEIRALAETAERLLAQRSPLTAVRERPQGGFDRELWKEEVALGWTGVAIPQELGGAGLGTAAAGALIEVCGRHVVAEPFLSTVCLATPVLLAADQPAGTELLEEIATDGRVVAVAVPAAANLVGCRTELELRGDATVAGRTQVLDLPEADVVLLPVSAARGVAWVAIDAEHVHAVGRLQLIDGRSVATAEFLGPTTPITAPRPFGEALAPVLSDGAALVSAWLLGLSERAFRLTLDYLKVREQFGSVIGSYQALQHRAARLRCELVVGRATVEAALEAQDANLSDRALLAAAAKARMGELALRVTGEAIQLHGGIGMTEEANIGLLFKAARIADLVGGHHLVHKRRAAALLGLDGACGG